MIHDDLPSVPLPAQPAQPVPAPDAITALDAQALSRAIHAKEFSCRDVMQAYLSRIEQVNTGFNALVALADPDELLAQADQCDTELAAGNSRGWLHGIPQAPKDLSAAKGLRCSMGSPLQADQVSGHDALIVARARAAGALMIGKSNTPEFGFGSHTFNEVYGATRNALNPDLTAGGSSGGAAVALALHLLPVADGSDMMGSLRNPGAFNGVYGLRPSQGRVPMHPIPEIFIQQLGIEGPMGRTPQECAALLATQAGASPHWPLSLPGDGQSFLRAAAITANDLDSAPLKGKRIGWLGDLDGYLATEPGLMPILDKAVQGLSQLGADVQAMPLAFDPDRLWRSWITLRQGLNGAKLVPLLKDPAKAAQLKPEARWEAENATRATAADYFAASVERSSWYQAVLGMFDKVDFLVLPTAQVFPFDITRRWPDEIAGRKMDTYHRWMEATIPATMAGLPAMNIPVLPAGASPFRTSGEAPREMAGYQLIGRPQDDLGVLMAAAAIHEAGR